MFGHQLFEGLLGLFGVSLGCQVVGMVHSANGDFFVHSYREDGVSFFELFVPSVIGVHIG